MTPETVQSMFNCSKLSGSKTKRRSKLVSVPWETRVPNPPTNTRMGIANPNRSIQEIAIMQTNELIT